MFEKLGFGTGGVTFHYWKSIKCRDISGPEYEWGTMKMGQWPMSHSFACKNQDFDGPF